MQIKTEWWGVVFYATTDDEAKQLRALLDSTDARVQDAYEEGTIDLLEPGDDEWDRVHGRDSLLSPAANAVAGLVIRR